jgi:hypothetical protein
MKKSLVLCLVLSLLAVAVVSPVLAKTPKRVARLSGWVVDEEGGAERANAASKDLVLAKAEEGIPLVFYTDKGEAYPIADQKAALSKVGEPWDVIGMIDGDGLLAIGSFIKPKDKAATAPEEEEAKPADQAGG